MLVHLRTLSLLISILFYFEQWQCGPQTVAAWTQIEERFLEPPHIEAKLQYHPENGRVIQHYKSLQKRSFSANPPEVYSTAADRHYGQQLRAQRRRQLQRQQLRRSSRQLRRAHRQLFIRSVTELVHMYNALIQVISRSIQPVYIHNNTANMSGDAGEYTYDAAATADKLWRYLGAVIDSGVTIRDRIIAMETNRSNTSSQNDTENARLHAKHAFDTLWDNIRAVAYDYDHKNTGKHRPHSAGHHSSGGNSDITAEDREAGEYIWSLIDQFLGATNTSKHNSTAAKNYSSDYSRDYSRDYSSEVVRSAEGDGVNKTTVGGYVEFQRENQTQEKPITEQSHADNQTTTTTTTTTTLSSHDTVQEAVTWLDWGTLGEWLGKHQPDVELEDMTAVDWLHWIINTLTAMNQHSIRSAAVERNITSETQTSGEQWHWLHDVVARLMTNDDDDDEERRLDHDQSRENNISTESSSNRLLHRFRRSYHHTRSVLSSRVRNTGNYAAKDRRPQISTHVRQERSESVLASIGLGSLSGAVVESAKNMELSGETLLAAVNQWRRKLLPTEVTTSAPTDQTTRKKHRRKRPSTVEMIGSTEKVLINYKNRSQTDPKGHDYEYDYELWKYEYFNPEQEAVTKSTTTANTVNTTRSAVKRTYPTSRTRSPLLLKYQEYLPNSTEVAGRVRSALWAQWRRLSPPCNGSITDRLIESGSNGEKWRISACAAVKVLFGEARLGDIKTTLLSTVSKTAVVLTVTACIFCLCCCNVCKASKMREILVDVINRSQPGMRLYGDGSIEMYPPSIAEIEAFQDLVEAIMEFK